MRYHVDEQRYKDPVCGMEISRKTAAAECAHLGKTYFFCSGGCREAFEGDPEKYLRHRREHGS
jgi:YHS domain-containing protein